MELEHPNIIEIHFIQNSNLNDLSRCYVKTLTR